MKKGFSLLEMLVAMATFTILMVILSEIVLSSLATVSSMAKQRDDGAEARQFFDRLEFELGRMVRSQDVDYSALKQQQGTLSNIYNSLSITNNPQAGNDQLVFFTESQGTFPGATSVTEAQRSPISLVSYQVEADLDSAPTGTVNTNPSLRRCSYGLYLDPSVSPSMPHLPTMISDAWPNLFQNNVYTTTSSSIFRLEYRYLIKSYTDPVKNTPVAAYFSTTPYNTYLSHTNANGMADVAAIVVTVALLDQKSRNQIPLSYNYSQLINLFPDAQNQNPGVDVATAWNAVISTGLGSAGIPQSVAANIRVYERTFYLN